MSTDQMETEETPEVAEKKEERQEEDHEVVPTTTDTPAAAAAAPEADADAANTETGESRSNSKKRPRSPSDPSGGGSNNVTTEPTASVSAASAAAAAQLSATMGWNGLYSLLTVSALTSAASLPTVEQVKQAAQKWVADCPPFVHLSKTDSAPQLKLVDDRRLHVKGAFRGYRMSRATHGINQGHYYYEVLILDPPKASEIAESLPSHVRMGPKLQEQLQQALQAEKEGKPADPDGFGAHVRLGFSNRTGDLQAPVGYDKWSFAIRDIGGSKIHTSQRDDAWGGESFGPGDVIGCAISMVPRKDGVLPAAVAAAATAGTTTASSVPSTVIPEATTNSTKGGSNGGGDGGSDTILGEDVVQQFENQIRFFKNGLPMGHEIINAKGKKESAVAFYVPDGVYYPAVSLYMGATVQVNFGPHFICPPRKNASSSAASGVFAKYKPVSGLCEPPMSVEDAVTKVQKEKVVRKADMMQKFQELVSTEVQVLQDSFTSHRKQHVQWVWKEREKRGATKMEDLEADEFFQKEETKK